MSEISESELRALVKAIYQRILTVFDAIDPDEAECEESLGSLSITFPDGARWILSVQPPVRQIWLAVASIGRAYHFDYDPSSARWLDDKEGQELLTLLETLLGEVAGLQLRF